MLAGYFTELKLSVQHWLLWMVIISEIIIRLMYRSGSTWHSLTITFDLYVFTIIGLHLEQHTQVEGLKCLPVYFCVTICGVLHFFLGLVWSVTVSPGLSPSVLCLNQIFVCSFLYYISFQYIAFSEEAACRYLKMTRTSLAAWFILLCIILFHFSFWCF